MKILIPAFLFFAESKIMDRIRFPT